MEHPDKMSEKELKKGKFKPFTIFGKKTKYFCNPKGIVYSAYLFHQCIISTCENGSKLFKFQHFDKDGTTEVYIRDIIMNVFGKPLNNLFEGYVTNKNKKLEDSDIKNLKWKVTGINRNVKLSKDITIKDKTNGNLSKWSKTNYTKKSQGFDCE